MGRMEIEAKLKEIKDKDAFAEELEKATNPDEMVVVLGKYGVDTSVEELEKEILPIFETEAGVELNETELENVAGGCSCGGWLPHMFYQTLRWLAKKALGIEVRDCR